MESFNFKLIILLTICIISLSQDVLAGKQCSTGSEHFKPIVFAPTIPRDVFRLFSIFEKYIMKLKMYQHTMVHYCEKLMGVVVFAKVQGPEGSADFQTLQVRGPL